MKVIYHCYGRAHSSVVAAHLHLGSLPMAGPVNIRQLLGLAEFDRADPSQWGIPHFMGRDEQGNEVYILGLNSQTAAGLRAITSLAWYLGKKRRGFPLQHPAGGGTPSPGWAVLPPKSWV